MKMKYTLTLGLALGLSTFAISQNVGINGTGAAPNASAMLDVVATDKGVLVPRVVLSATNVAAPVTGPATALLVYNTATAGAGATAVTPGFYYWDGSQWVRFMNGNGTAWMTLGNAGTSPATNFIGTTDAQAFVTKTGGSAASNERFRILATGAGSYNNPTPFAGDVFSVYGTGYTGATNALGAFAVSGYVGTSGIGVYGESNSAAANDGTGVLGSLLGTSTATGTASFGVYGENFTTPAGTGIAYGVYGYSDGATGNARGANGTVRSPNGIGVSAFNLATTGNAYGSYSQTASTAGIASVNINTATSGANAAGLYAESRSTAGTAAVILNTALTGTNTALYSESYSTGAGSGAFVASNGTDVTLYAINFGTTPATNGEALYAETDATVAAGAAISNTNTAGTGISVGGQGTAPGTFVGGSGAAISGTTAGTISTASTAVTGIGIIGAGNGQTPLLASSGAGVLGVGAQYGVMGFANTTVITSPSSNAAANAANASSGGYFEVRNGGTAQTWSYVAVREAAGGGGLRKIIGTGTVNTIVKDLNNNYVALTCPEAPENLFQDYGQGKLVNGFAHIELDPILAKNIVVNEEHPLRVFIQLEGDCQGVFVTNKTGNGFDVKELNGGSSNVSFSWSITANRADEVLPDGTVSRYSIERFPAAPGPIETENLEEKKSEQKDIKSKRKDITVTEAENINTQEKVQPIKKK